MHFGLQLWRLCCLGCWGSEFGSISRVTNVPVKSASYRICGYLELLRAWITLGIVVKKLFSGSSGVMGGCPYLEVHCTYNLLRNCSYNLSISRVTGVMGLIFRL